MFFSSTFSFLNASETEIKHNNNNWQLSCHAKTETTQATMSQHEMNLNLQQPHLW